MRKALIAAVAFGFVPLVAGGCVSKSEYMKQVQATDQAGTKGNLESFTIVLQATNLGQPIPPATPSINLNPADDSSGVGRVRAGEMVR